MHIIMMEHLRYPLNLQEEFVCGQFQSKEEMDKTIKDIFFSLIPGKGG